MNGLNPQKMRQMMRQMGIRQEDVAAESVLIRCADRDIVIEHPEVAKVHMMGQETWQIVGRAREQPRAAEAPPVSEDDVATVMAQCACSREAARAALEAAGGDLARAILDLQASAKEGA